MITCNAMKKMTTQILQNRDFEIISSDNSCIVFAGFGATGRVSFAIKNGETHLRFYYTKKYTLQFENNWQDEKLRFMMANRFSKVREGIFKIYYEPPGGYECVSYFNTTIIDSKLYEELLNYLLCIAIEGYAVLNCEKFYEATSARNDLKNIFEKNIATLSPWKYPGFCVSKYA